MSALEKEMRRRVWWCVYELDRVLSIALGRPSGAHDDDCDVEMRESTGYFEVLHIETSRTNACSGAVIAVELDDSQLLVMCEGSTVSPAGTTSYMTGFVACVLPFVFRSYFKLV